MSRFARAIVQPAWLRQQLQAANSNVRIFDCSVVLDGSDPTKKPYRVVSGAEGYEKCHIKCADYFHLPEFAKGADSVAKDKWGNPLQFMMPPPAEFLTKVGARKGITNDDHVVLYSHIDPKWATRVWWMFYAAGYGGEYSVLDGGLKKWVAEGGETEAGPYTPQTAYPPTQLQPVEGLIPKEGDSGFVGKTAVAAAAVEKSAATPVIHTLPKSVYDGATDKYGRPGHISNAVCVPASQFVRSDDCDTFRSADEVKALFTAAGIDKPQSITTYCGAGVTASLPAFLAFTQLGWDTPVRIYDGSLSEWCSDPEAPMA